ncbi:hypothetical protein OH710_06645 [Pseudomonas capsici]|uniref:hypothetical protein n=1 Tax=Pseudomonas capsici TaxID=2810614 RepID=UPI0021F19F8D|nr:hypothetical protein [Pseudomonas capsici]MCV4272317.1 hypothetical protein [Pseudomonas capsici]
MIDELKALKAQVEAQSFVIEELLAVCLKAGLADFVTIESEWRSVRQSPTFFAADPIAKRKLADELDAWADILIMRLPAP